VTASVHPYCVYCICISCLFGVKRAKSSSVGQEGEALERRSKAKPPSVGRKAKPPRVGEAPERGSRGEAPKRGLRGEAPERGSKGEAPERG
jgi:hypothetical protein